MANEVRHNVEASRYELLADGELVGIADYRITDDRIVFPHTEIDASRRGQGLGAVLVRGALDDVAGSGRTVVAQCWYVAEFIDENPEYQPLLAATG
jgi:predicted GNAT family acetyltransferase